MVDRKQKRKKKAENVCKGTPDIEFEQGWSVGLGSTLSDRKLKTIFQVSRIFLGKADSVILLGFECTINTQNVNKIVEAIFQKIDIFQFFLTWTNVFTGKSLCNQKNIF